MAFEVVDSKIGALARRRDGFCRYRTNRHPANEAGASGGRKCVNVSKRKTSLF